MNRDTCLCAATTSAKYHQRRHSFLWTIDTFFNLVIVISAATAFGFLLGGDKRVLAQFATAAITLLGICQIVLGIGKASFAHQVWYRQWRELLVEIERNKDPDTETLHQWNLKITAIETECISELRALEVDCRNKAIMSLDFDEEEIRVIRWWQRLGIQLGTLQSDFPKKNGV